LKDSVSGSQRKKTQQQDVRACCLCICNATRNIQHCNPDFADFNRYRPIILECTPRMNGITYISTLTFKVLGSGIVSKIFCSNSSFKSAFFESNCSIRLFFFARSRLRKFSVVNSVLSEENRSPAFRLVGFFFTLIVSFTNNSFHSFSDILLFASFEFLI